MSRKNVAIAQGFYEAIGRCNIPTILVAMDRTQLVLLLPFSSRLADRGASLRREDLSARLSRNVCMEER